MATENVEKTVGDFVTLQRGNTYSGKLVGELGPTLLGLGSIEPGGGFRHDKYKSFGGECPPKIMPLAAGLDAGSNQPYAVAPPAALRHAARLLLSHSQSSSSSKLTSNRNSQYVAYWPVADVQEPLINV